MCKQNFVIACGYFLVERMYESDSTLYLGDPSCNRENVQSCVNGNVYFVSRELFLEWVMCVCSWENLGGEDVQT